MTNVTAQAESLADDLIRIRRDLHAHAEAGWTEFRTAALVVKELTTLGWNVAYGPAVFHPEYRAGLPSAADLERHMARALAWGADPAIVQAMAGGYTGVVATLTNGEGPTVALRFDMDALDAVESTAAEHRPTAEGFASKNPVAMHACGHDGHTAIGLGVARLLMALKDELHGTIKLIFQPAEEGVRGGRAMAEAGVVDGVDYLLGAHLGFAATETGLIVSGTAGFLATTKLDAVFTGAPAHAGAAPEQGKNALLAAAAAALNLHAIARHSQGASRINVGVLQAGTGRNVVPATATLKLETRGETSAIDQYMAAEAERIIRASAAMWDVTVRIERQGSAAGATSDTGLAAIVGRAAAESPLVTRVVDQMDLGGSEDCTWLMQRVQQQGGQAAYLLIGSKIAAPHHDFKFDFDESSLVIGVDVLVRSVLALASR